MNIYNINSRKHWWYNENYFIRWCKKTRKKRANELDDDNFEYEAYDDKNSNDEEKNKIINDE